MPERTARRGRPPESAQGDTRGRILTEATKLFARQGFHGTSTAEIGAAAGVQSGALYYHIKSKDELLWEILRDYVEQMRESTLAVAAAHSDPVDRLSAMITSHITMIIKLRRQVTIELRDGSALSKGRLGEFQELRDDVQRVWQETLTEGHRNGSFITDDRAITNGTLSMISLVSQWYRRGGKHSPDEIGQIMTRYVLRGLGLDAPEPSAAADPA